MVTKKLKYPKNINTLFDREDVMNYLFYLEDNDALGKLEAPILAYYVIADRLLNEVDNGGFEQYITNSSVATLPHLKASADLLGNEELCEIVNDLLNEINKRFDFWDVVARKDLDFDDEFEDFLSRLDERFYALNDKYDIEKLAKSFYQTHIPEGKIEIEIVKYPETDKLRYFVKNVDNVSNEEATNAFVDYLNGFVETQWKIEIMKFGESFRIVAIDESNSVNLEEVFKNFTESKSATKMLKFEQITIIAGFYGTEHHEIEIKPSGFEKNEFIMRHFCAMRGLSAPMISYITLGYFNLTYKDYNLEEFEQILIKRAKAQDNIILVYEEDHTMLCQGRNVVFEKAK